eukprot:Hpha_TRINITY_DN4524_c0_g1::TRINITY_DN4524_c0_g1_i1::g.115409::m.115409
MLKRTVLCSRNLRMWAHVGFGYQMKAFGRTTRGPDWEFADGTPPPATAVQSYHKRSLRYYMESIIEACATVEEMAEKNQLPIRPATENIRRYDPRVPLYLPIEDMVMTEQSTTAEKYEMYADRAVYFDPENQTQPPPQDAAAEAAPEAATPPPSVKTSTKRRRKVSMVKPPSRFMQGPQAKPVITPKYLLQHGHQTPR